MKTKTIVRLTNTTVFDIEIVNIGSLEKAKPFVRRGRKAAGAEQVSAWPSC